MRIQFFKKLSFRFKLFLSFILFGLFILMIAYYTIMVIDKTKSKEIYSKISSEKFIQKEKEFYKFVNDYARNKLFFLKDEFINQHMNTNSNYSVLGRIFKGVIDSDINIMQLRFIDTNGNEKVRVEKKIQYSKATITKTGDLQNKKHRDYFYKTMQLKANTIWYSNIDANIENKRIEKPLRPVLRIGTPIFINNKKVGIVVINLFMNNYLQRFLDEENFDIFIVDEHGNYIAHPNKEKSFSKYKKSNYTIKDDFKEISSNILNQNSYNFDAIYSKHINYTSNNKMILLVKPKNNSFEEFSLENKNTLILLFILILIISIPSAHFLSYIPAKLYLTVKEKEKEIENIMKDLLITKENLHIQEHIIITTNGIEIESCNKAFLNLFKLKSLDEFLFEFHTVSELFIKKDGYFYFDNEEHKNYTWVSYVYEHLDGKCTVEMSDLKATQSYIFKININMLESKEGYYVVSLNDITDMSIQTKKLTKIANYDSLTKIYNRKYFDETLENSLFQFKDDPSLNISIIMFDIDNFKKVNDTLGHNVGDEVIKTIATISKNSIREDDIIARWGGEEFVIILNNSNQNIATKIAEKIRDKIYKTKIDNIPNISCSFGVHQFKEEDTHKTILESVDKYLYQAKRTGKNRVCHA